MRENGKTEWWKFLISILAFVATVYIREIFALVYLLLCNTPQNVFIFFCVTFVAIIKSLKK